MNGSESQLHEWTNRKRLEIIIPTNRYVHLLADS